MIPKYTKCSRCGESYDPTIYDDCPYCSDLDETDEVWYNEESDKDYFLRKGDFKDDNN